jgi:hypothetical protein
LFVPRGLGAAVIFITAGLLLLKVYRGTRWRVALLLARDYHVRQRRRPAEVPQAVCLLVAGMAATLSGSSLVITTPG